MKILHVVSSYWPAYEFGGPIQSVHLLNKFLAKKGADITVYTTNSGLRENREILLTKETDLDGVKVFYFPYYGYVHFTFSPSLFWALRKNVKNFDLVHITGVWNFPVFAAAFWARFYKKPYIISPRGSLMKEPLEKKRPLLKQIYLFLIAKRDFKKASAIHFTVEAEKEEYIRADLPLKKFFIIPNGLDMEEFKENIEKGIFRKKWGIPDDKRVILFLGRLNWKKGLDTLIPAFSEVIKKEQKALLVIAGPDDEGYSKNIKEAAISFGLMYKTNPADNKIIFTSIITGRDKISAFLESDVFVLPSYSENFGMAVIEAMYFGLPVIITKYVGIAPYVLKNQAGLVIEKDERELANAILKILNNPDLAKEMGQHGRYLVETEFSPVSVAEKFLNLYKELKS